MAITNTWSVSNMVRNDSDGGVITVYWSCVASDGTYSATEGGKLRLTPDASADDFVAYDDLTEEVVMGWVHADVDKDATEAALTANIAGQKNPVSADGMPW